MKVKNNPDEYIKRGDNIPGSQHTYAEKLELTKKNTIKDKILEIFDRYSEIQDTLCLESTDWDNVADEILALFEQGCPKCGQRECQQHGYFERNEINITP